MSRRVAQTLAPGSVEALGIPSVEIGENPAELAAGAAFVAGCIIVGCVLTASYFTFRDHRMRRNIRRDLARIPDVGHVVALALSRDEWHCVVTVTGHDSLVSVTRQARSRLDVPSRSTGQVPGDTRITLTVQTALDAIDRATGTVGTQIRLRGDSGGNCATARHLRIVAPHKETAG